MDNRGGFGPLLAGPSPMPTYTWATKPAVGRYEGDTIYLSDYNYAPFTWYGGKWHVGEGVVAQIYHLVPNPKTTFTGATEQIIWQKKINAGLLHATHDITPQISMTSKSAGVETQTNRLYIGKLGTTADTLIDTTTTTSANVTNTLGGNRFAWIDATTLRKLDANAAPTSFTIDNTDLNDIFVTCTVQLSVGAETISLEEVILNIA